jgi:beta-lactam-binding protein with PASTA domain
MKILLVFYLLFIILVALSIAYLSSRLHFRFQARFLIIILAVIISPVIISYFLLSYLYPLPETTVPDLDGFTEEQAVKKIREAGLLPHIEKKYPGEDYVTFQRPEAGREVKEGRAVTIIIGKPRSINYIAPSPEAAPETPAEEPENVEEGEETQP